MSEPGGFNLQGESAPFTAAGGAGMAAAEVSYAAGATEVNTVGHRGLVVSWQADPDAAAGLLPVPLEADENTSRIVMTITECQSARSAEFMARAHPALVAWHEAAIFIPCTFEGRAGAFSWIRYVDTDHGVLRGLFRGLAAKRATFATTFPFAGQPGNREMAIGNVAAATASRFDAELFAAYFTCTAEGAPPDAPLHRLARQYGVRFMPDWMTPGGPPLVDDIVVWEFAGWSVTRAFTGSARVRLSDARDEELALLGPVAPAESYYAEFSYRDGPGACRVVADLRAAAGPRRAASGAVLRGASQPFTQTGDAALGRSTDLGGDEGAELSQAGHIGIYLNWRVDPDRVAQLIPWPLEVVPESERVWLFMNETQSGINRHNVDGSASQDWLRELRPHHINWHEAMFRVPCAYRGELGYLLYVQYKDRDHSIYLGTFDSFTTKLADFRVTFPMSGHPFNGEMAPGRAARMVLSRFNERIMTAHFTATRELPREEIEEGDINILGVRHFPDYTGAGRPPLVHDVVNWHMVNRSYARAWVGDADITFGTSSHEELYLLEPLEMLPSLFVYLEYQGGPGTASVVHDYLTGRQADAISPIRTAQASAPRYRR